MSESITRRVARANLAVSFGLLAVLGIVVWGGVRLVLLRQLDAALREEARLIAAMVVMDDGVLEYEFDALGTGGETTPRRFQLRAAGGRSVYRSPGLRGADVPQPSGAAEWEFGWWRPETGKRLRCVSHRFTPFVEGRPPRDGITPELSLVLARSAASLDAVLLALLTLLAGCAVLLGLAAANLSRRAAERGLRPLREFAARIQELDPESLDTRVDVSGVPPEVSPVGRRLNELLDGLQVVMERERSWSADIAHELRTPLAGIRAALEVADDASDLASAHQSVLKLESLVNRLLWMVKLESGAAPVEISTVEPGDVLESLADDLRGETCRRGLQWYWDLESRVAVATDPVLLTLALRNLVENAVAYADEGGEIRARVRPGVIEITNTGSDVDPAELPRLVRRFARADPARRAVGAQCGLGLSLVDRVCKRLGHRFDVTSRDGVFRATIRFREQDSRWGDARRASGAPAPDRLCG